MINFRVAGIASQSAANKSEIDDDAAFFVALAHATESAYPDLPSRRLKLA